MKKLLVCLTIFFALASCAQSAGEKTKTAHIGGPCEGCEAIHETPVPFDRLTSIDTLPDFSGNGPKIFIEGTVFGPDGKTPAPGIVIYVYHTDQTGRYPTRAHDKGWALRHGYLRGWMKTDVNGRYGFYTLRPASYPNSSNPQHIHVTIKEPGKNEYWIDDFHFSDDPLLTSEMKKGERSRGGSGIVQLKADGALFKATRNIYLGMNIPAYY